MAVITCAETGSLAAPHAQDPRAQDPRAAAHAGPAPPHEAVLVALTAIGPVSFQVFLPALPAIQSGLGTSPGTAQLALSLSMLGIAVAALAYGPLSDRFGRRPTLLAGMAVLVAGSLLCACATSIAVLIAGRVVQAAGGASGMVVARAIVMDVHGRDGARTVLARLMTAMMAAPMLATPVGGLLADRLGWRANFGAVALCAAAMLALIWRSLPETRRDATHPTPLAAGARLLRAPAFAGYALQSGFGMAALLAFTTASPAYFAQRLGIGATRFGVLLVVVTAGFMAGSLGASRFSARLALGRAVLLGSLAAVAASAAALGLALAGVWTAWALVAPAALLGAANGLSMPSAQAGAVAAVPELSGTASGLAGFVGTLLGAAATQAVGSLHDGTPVPIAGAMALASILALAAALLAGSGGGQPRGGAPQPPGPPHGAARSGRPGWASSSR